MTDEQRAILLVGDSETNQNLYYATRFLAGDPFVYLATPDRAVLLVSAMERGRAVKESSVSEVRSFDELGYQDLLDELNDREAAFERVLVRLLQEEGVTQVHVDRSFAAVYADALRAAGVAVAIDRSLLLPERRRKSEDEITSLARAQQAAEAAILRAVEVLRQSEARGDVLYFDGALLTSEQLSQEQQYVMQRRHMATSLPPIVACGPGGADPHWLGAGPLRRGEPIVMDVFPRDRAGRYWGDITRTVVVGPASPELEAMFAAVQRAKQAALAEIRAGANGRDVHRAAQRVFAEDGFGEESDGPRFIHGTGHGVGLELHEAPSLGRVDVELLEGDVVTVEPGLYDPRIGGVRIEDLVVVTRDGYRNLTTLPDLLPI